MDADTPFADVLAGARQREPSACTEIWRRFSPSVAGYLRSRGSGDPDDLTSEVFLAGFRAIPTFVGGEPEFRALLFTIARRRLIDEFRSKSRRAPQQEWRDHDDPRESPSAEDEGLESLGIQEVRRSLAELSDEQRDVLMLRLMGDLTVDQIAEVLGKSQGAVKALQRRGLVALRQRLAHAAPELVRPSAYPSGPGQRFKEVT